MSPEKEERQWVRVYNQQRQDDERENLRARINVPPGELEFVEQKPKGSLV